MSALKLPPNNILLYGVLGVGALWFMRQARARPVTRVTGVARSPVPADSGLAGIFGQLLPRAGTAAAGAPTIRMPTVGGSSSAPGVPDENARAAVRFGDPSYGAGNAGNNAGASDLGVPTDAARAAVRFGDSSYGPGSAGNNAADSVIGNAAPAIAYAGNTDLTNWAQGGDYGAFL